MSERLTDLLVAERAKLLTKVAKIDEALRAIRDAECLLEGRDPEPASRKRCALTPRDIATAARRLLIEHGRPMKRGALVRLFEQNGILIDAPDKAKHLGTILWRHRTEFTRLDGLGYWPSDIPTSRRTIAAAPTAEAAE